MSNVFGITIMRANVLYTILYIQTVSNINLQHNVACNKKTYNAYTPSNEGNNDENHDHDDVQQFAIKALGSVFIWPRGLSWKSFILLLNIIILNRWNTSLKIMVFYLIILFPFLVASILKWFSFFNYWIPIAQLFCILKFIIYYFM